MLIRKIKTKVGTFVVKVGADGRTCDKSRILPQSTGFDELDKIIEHAGYAYDPEQDIFYSVMSPWQREIGYCRLYDEMSAPFGMIIDCEPIHFKYKGKKWMIGLWKGQYDLVSGAEIGVYKKTTDLSIPGLFYGTYYKCASDPERLQMSYTLKKNGTEFFTREGEHWWLTGFKLGDFAEPSELTMDVSITLDDIPMRDAFIKGLRKAGYHKKELAIDNNTVKFTFDVPRTPQPISRTPSTDVIIQSKNKLLCKMYQDVIKPYDNIFDKMKAIQEKMPELYKNIFYFGKSKLLLEVYGRIKDHLNFE